MPFPSSRITAKARGPGTAAVGTLLIAMVSYQCGAAIATGLFPRVGAQGAVAYRLALGALLLLAWRRPWRRWRAGADWRALCGYGLAMGAMNLSFYLSLRSIPLGIAMALEFTGPLALALASSRHWRDVGWIVLTIGGLFLLLPLGDRAHALDPLGVAYALAAGVGWALYVVLGQRAGAAWGVDAVTWGTLVAALAVLPIGLAHAGAALFAPDLALPALGVAVLSSALPYSLEMIALTRLPARTFGVLLSLEPAVGAVAGVAFLGQQLRALQWLAIGAIIVASAGTALGARRRPSDPVTELH